MAKTPKLHPGGGLDIFTDRNQRSFFFLGGGGVSNFENLYILDTGHSCCMFLGCQTNAVFLSISCFRQCFLGAVLFTSYFSKHRFSLLISFHT